MPESPRCGRRLHAADVVALTKGSVWEILTTPEEQVPRGHDLLRMLDCSEPVVTAVVGEAVSSRSGPWLLSRPEQGGRRDKPSHARPILHRAWPTSVRHNNLDGLLAIAPVGRAARIAVTAPAYRVGGSLQEVARDNTPSK
jgi:hypothetical protein